MSEKDFVSVVVVNWNRKNLVKSCLDSLKKQSFRNFEIIVVDNASTDGSVDLIENFYPEVKLIKNNKNLLYSFALNQGIKEAQGEFILCLNNDTILDKDFLKEVVQVMNVDSEIGIVSGKVLWGDGKFIDTTGQFLSPSRKPVERGYKEKDQGQYESGGFIFGAGGVAPLYKRQMLEEIKINDGEYFDSDFGLFYEDLDLNWRAELFGWRAYYNPRAICFHIRGGSRKLRDPWFQIFEKFDYCHLLPEHKIMLLKNRYSTIIKNDCLRNFLRDLGFILTYDFKLWLYILFLEPLSMFRMMKYLKFILLAIKKRKVIKAKLAFHRKFS